MTRYTPTWLQQGSYAASVDRRLLASLVGGQAACSGCAVTAGTGMTVNVAAGQMAVPTQNSTGSTLCVSDAVEVVTLAAAPASGNNRYDVIICQPRGNDLDGGSNNDFIFTSVTGTAAASPTVPPTPPGALALAQIYVAGGSASVVAGNITDVRPFMLNGPTEPATTSATIVSRRDVTGEVWVAKAGVNGGLWRKARDVLHVRVARNAAYNFTNTTTTLAFDTVINDDYGLCNLSNGAVTVPVPGIWRAEGRAVANTAAAMWVNLGINQNSVTKAQGILSAGATYYLVPAANAVLRAVAGDTLYAVIQGSTTIAGFTAEVNTNFQVDYLGTG
jgi:hypothetical protein